MKPVKFKYDSLDVLPYDYMGVSRDRLPTWSIKFNIDDSTFFQCITPRLSKDKRKEKIIIYLRKYKIEKLLNITTNTDMVEFIKFLEFYIENMDKIDFMVNVEDKYYTY